MTLERDLRALAGGFPDAPALAPGVLVAVQQASRRRRRRRVAMLAIALVLLVPATALAVSPGLRGRVLESFGLRSVRVERVVQLPAVGPEARRLQLGTKVSLQQARSALGSRVSAPATLGAPDGIFEQRLPRADDVSFLYEPRTVAARLGVRRRVLVSVLRGTLAEQFLGKTIAQANAVEHLSIEGTPALLISGPPHLMMVFRSNGEIDQTYTRLAGTTLLWQRGPLLVRVEGSLSRAHLVAIARSLAVG